MQLMRGCAGLVLALLLTSSSLLFAQSDAGHRIAEPRARDIGIPFDGTPGPLNAITDVAGVEVGATDAPLTPDQLKRLARRVPLGLGRAGAIEMNGSGDIFLAFSTANVGADDGNSDEDADKPHSPRSVAIQRLVSWEMDPLFAAVTQATEEAVDNALIAAKTMIGPNYWVVQALPQDQLKAILRKHDVLKQ